MQSERIIQQRVDQTMVQERFKMKEMEQRIIYLEGELKVINLVSGIMNNNFIRLETINYKL